jgi:pimeloyl-ACP methyl ester carboxylesterase
MKRIQILGLNIRPLIGGLFLLLITVSANSSDRVKEQTLEAAIKAALVSGEIVHLAANGRPFLALHTEADGQADKGVAILLHGQGSSPVQVSVIEPLRVRLPEMGWGTLSLQMPVLEAGAESRDYYPLIPEAVSRIESAILFLEAKEVDEITLVGHSMGALMALSHLAKETDSKVSMAVVIGLPVPSTDQANADTLEMLGKVNHPLLDLYGSRDLSIVVKTAKKRQKSAANNRYYQQVKVDSANHFFRGLDTLLVSRVSGWMSRIAETTITVPVEQNSKEKIK